MKMELEHVHTVRKKLKDGSYREYYFHRKTRKSIKGKPGTLEFFASYQEACEQGINESGTLKALIIDYFSSQNFASKAPRTQKDYRKYVKYIEDKFGSMPIQALNDKRIRGDFITWRDDLAKQSPRLADHCLNLLKAILKLAADKNLIEVSYAHGIPNVYNGNRSDKIWLPEQVEAILKCSKPCIQRAILFALNTGQRAGDLRMLKWNENIKNGMITLRPSKTKRLGSSGRLVTFPQTPALAKLIQDIPRDSEYVLTNASGQPWDRLYFSQEFVAARKAANIEGLTFNDFRGTAVTTLWEAGAPEAEIASITGHSLKSVGDILDRYTGRTSKMSANAMTKLGDSWIGNLSIGVN